MSRTATLLKVLLFSLLVLLSVSQAASVSAGTDVGQTPIFTCDGVSEILPAECNALVALYNSTNGPGWETQTGWLATNTPCSWYGVTCETGHVQQLSLSDNHLSGTIPPELRVLTSLQYFSLTDNQLSGVIPSALGDLTSLHGLYLSHNQLSGPIPLKLGSLPNLELLWLDSNQLTGDIPSELGDLVSLWWINLSGNQLSGPIPLKLGSLPNLEVLYISGNQLSGNIPPELGNAVQIGTPRFELQPVDRRHPARVG